MHAGDAQVSQGVSVAVKNVAQAAEHLESLSGSLKASVGMFRA